MPLYCYIIEKYYPNDEHMIKWAESMKNKPKDWSNFLLAIAMLLSALLITSVSLEK